MHTQMWREQTCAWTLSGNGRNQSFFRDIGANICHRYTQSLSVLEVWGVLCLHGDIGLHEKWLWRALLVDMTPPDYSRALSTVLFWSEVHFQEAPWFQCPVLGSVAPAVSLLAWLIFPPRAASLHLNYPHYWVIFNLYCIIEGDSLLPSFLLSCGSQMSSAGADRGVLLHPEKCAECTGLMFSSRDVA